MLTYNRINVVGHMIDDILSQTYQDYEFIIVDNGSDDGTSELLSRVSKSDSRIKVVTITAGSIGRARNIGLKNSAGDYIAYVDDDDRVEADFLEFLIKLRDEFDADISMCGASEGDGVTRSPQCLFDERLILNGEDAVKLLLGRKYIRNGTATKLYRRSLLEMFPFVENYRNEDLHTQYKYFLASKIVALHGVDKYYITRHDGNVSGFTGDASKWNAQTIQDYLDAYHNRTIYLKENAPNLYDYALYSEWSLMISMIEKINKYNLMDCDDIAQKLVRELRDNKDRFLAMPELKDFERKLVNDYIENPA